MSGRTGLIDTGNPPYILNLTSLNIVIELTRVNRVYETADEAFSAEMKDVLVYILDLSNNLEYVNSSLNKKHVLTSKRENILLCLLHMKNRYLSMTLSCILSKLLLLA